MPLLSNRLPPLSEEVFSDVLTQGQDKSKPSAPTRGFEVNSGAAEPAAVRRRGSPELEAQVFAARRAGEPQGASLGGVRQLRASSRLQVRYCPTSAALGTRRPAGKADRHCRRVSECPRLTTRLDRDKPWTIPVLRSAPTPASRYIVGRWGRGRRRWKRVGSLVPAL